MQVSGSAHSASLIAPQQIILYVEGGGIGITLTTKVAATGANNLERWHLHTSCMNYNCLPRPVLNNIIIHTQTITRDGDILQKLGSHREELATL